MPQSAGTFDYVIVGAGSAGCVLARRLSGRDASVLVLEAGGPDDKRAIRIPAAFPELFESNVDWKFTTGSQSALDGRELYWPRGKTLGGSSAINAMIYVRGHPRDYEKWVDHGNPTWAYDDHLPYYQRAEDITAHANDTHGTDGPLHVTIPDDPHPLSETFIDAAQATGLDRTHNFNTAQRAGVGYYHLTWQHGQRQSVADAYLTSVRNQSTLTVETNARATRITLTDDDEQATGVIYEQENTRYQVTAEQDVIISAGAVNSPHLLLLSGIGPPDHLSEHGIEVRQALPGVGRNLHDHLVVPVVYEAATTNTLDDSGGLLDLARYVVAKSGPLTSNLAEAGGFARTESAGSAPDLQFHFAPAYFLRHGFDNPETGHGFSIGVTHLHPASRGQIRLHSADPTADPMIDPQYLTEEGDMEALIEGVRIAREIGRADPFDDAREREVLPGEDATTREEIRTHIRERAQTIYHPVGTCKMGDDETAVVDETLQVHGIDGLRVVDASIMPAITSGNTNAPTIALAERAADLITKEREIQ